MKRILSRGRSDDNIDILKNRILSYEKETLPIIEELSKFSHVVKIDGSSSIGKINKNLINAFRYLL